MNKAQTRVVKNLVYLIKKSLGDARLQSDRICDFGPEDNEDFVALAEKELKVAKEFIDIAKRTEYFPRKTCRVLSFDYHDALEKFVVQKNIYEDILSGVWCL